MWAALGGRCGANGALALGALMAVLMAPVAAHTEGTGPADPGSSVAPLSLESALTRYRVPLDAPSARRTPRERGDDSSPSKPRDPYHGGRIPLEPQVPARPPQPVR